MAALPRPVLVTARQVMRLYWRLARPMTLGVRALVVDAEGKVLLVRHRHYDGWYLPGGGVGRGETVRQAVLRELREETGVVPRSDPEFIGLYANFLEWKSDHVALFRVDAFTMDFKANLEIAEHRFAARDALPEGTTEGTKARIAEVLGDGAEDDHWSPRSRRARERNG